MAKALRKDQGTGRKRNAGIEMFTPDDLDLLLEENPTEAQIPRGVGWTFKDLMARTKKTERQARDYLEGLISKGAVKKLGVREGSHGQFVYAREAK